MEATATPTPTPKTIDQLHSVLLLPVSELGGRCVCVSVCVSVCMLGGQKGGSDIMSRAGRFTWKPKRKISIIQSFCSLTTLKSTIWQDVKGGRQTGSQPVVRLQQASGRKTGSEWVPTWNHLACRSAARANRHLCLSSTSPSSSSSSSASAPNTATKQQQPNTEKVKTHTRHGPGVCVSVFSLRVCMYAHTSEGRNVWMHTYTHTCMDILVHTSLFQ